MTALTSGGLIFVFKFVDLIYESPNDFIVLLVDALDKLPEFFNPILQLRRLGQAGVHITS